MVYKVIGLMSGSSLDGLDIAHVLLEEVRGKWSYKILHADCLEYNDQWAHDLRHASDLKVGEFLKLNTSYGRYLGARIKEFIARHELSHQVNFIASHGHTVFHEPEHNTTCQIGDGATIAAVTGLPVISDLRSMDVALGGQGAPIVPIGDKLLFSEYDYLLNLGGIANITVPHNGSLLAFDVCPANQVLNELAEREGKAMDENGAMALQGVLLPDILDELNSAGFYKMAPPKSLSNEAAKDLVFPKLFASSHNNYDLLHTVTQHIADQVAEVVRQFPIKKENATLYATGGGTFNSYLMLQIGKAIARYNVTIVVPDARVVKYKEALVMALIGVLRWREEENVLCSVTGASKDSVGGAIWLG